MMSKQSQSNNKYAEFPQLHESKGVRYGLELVREVRNVWHANTGKGSRHIVTIFEGQYVGVTETGEVWRLWKAREAVTQRWP